METHKAKSTAKQSEVSLRSIRRPGLESSSGSRTQALRRGTRGVDAERGMAEQERPVMTCPQSSDVGWKTAQHFPPQASSKFLPGHDGLRCKQVGKLRVTRQSPIARPSRQHQTPLSGGRAQVAWKGLSGMDAARAAMGQGWPFAAGPWNVTGAREPRRSRGRMQGQDFLVPLGGAGHPATAKRNSPSRAKPARHTSAASDSHLQPRPQASHPTRPPAAHPTPAICHCTRPQ